LDDDKIEHFLAQFGAGFDAFMPAPTKEKHLSLVYDFLEAMMVDQNILATFTYDFFARTVCNILIHKTNQQDDSSYFFGCNMFVA